MRKRRIVWLGLAIVAVVGVATAVHPWHGPCDNGRAVPDPGSNPDLVIHCTILLRAKTTLAGAAELDWSPETPVSSWQGVTVLAGAVAEIRLRDMSLDGRIPAELGSLHGLEVLDLSSNDLTGSIPRELGNLRRLEVLDLDYNDLTGSIPKELGNLSRLEKLSLAGNPLTGSIPAELGNLHRLEELSLAGRRRGHLVWSTDWGELTGSVPKALGNLSRLEILKLERNELAGRIPAELGRLFQLEMFVRWGNELSLGRTTPRELRDVPDRDHREFPIP